MQPEEATIQPHWLTRNEISPLQFGLSFLILVGIPFSLWSLYADHAYLSGLIEKDRESYITYIQNVSWSLSLLVIFPLFLGLSLHFYNTYPRVFQYLYNTTAIAPDKAIFLNLCKKIDRSVNHKMIPFAAFLASLLLTVFLFNEYLSNCDVISWMTNGDIFDRTCESSLDHKGLSSRGVTAFIILVILATWVLIFAIRSMLFIRGLFDLFNSSETNIRLDPFHPDGVSGLAKLSSLATLQAMLLFLLGIYVSLSVIDRLYLQKVSLFSDIGNPILIVGYIVIAPLMFFFILGTAHNKMREAKESVISIICDKIKDTLEKIRLESDITVNRQNFDYLKILEEQKSWLDKSVLVWPFDIKSIQGFFSAILTPRIAPLIAGTVQLVKYIQQL